MPTAEHIFTMWQQFMDFCQHQANIGNRRNETLEMEDKTLTRFLRFNPPRFKGEPDDRKAEAWIQEIEKIFRVLNYSERQQVKYATFLFEDAACYWWRIIEREWNEEGIDWTWEAFKAEFLQKFIPQVLRDAREREFMNLIQGAMTVMDYEAKYNRLIQYAPHIITDERRRTRKFIEGLKPELRRALVSCDLPNYNRAVEKAMGIENEFQELQKLSEKWRKEKGMGQVDFDKGKKNFQEEEMIIAPKNSSKINKGKAP